MSRYFVFALAIFLMSFLDRLFNRRDPKEAMAPLYQAIIATGRQPHWYLDGAVPDTLDGRFDMIAAITAQVLIRLEGEDAKQESVWLTELFVDDMDGQLRQSGVGDVVVGKHIGRMMSALGGRISAYRAALLEGGDLSDTIRRNIYRSEEPSPAALAHVEGAMRAHWTALQAMRTEDIKAGKLP